ncbi:hypothetical protein MMC12_005708 [Toensbergia leucococca]|nr:hypothetical protein [Toensbergia leucococca]
MHSAPIALLLLSTLANTLPTNPNTEISLINKPNTIPLPASTTIIPSNPHDLAIGGVYICADINWGGTCGYAVQPTYTCIDLGSDWDKKISSFGPDESTECVLYNVHGCLPDYASFPNGQPDIHYPGVADMRTISFNDLTSSFRCYPTSSGAATEL